jgi:acylphosphatase
MNSQPEIFFPYEKLLVAIVRSGVDFAVVGGIAISLNGFVRATEDVDILVNAAPDNLRKLLACLEQWGEGWARELKVDDFVIQEGSIRVVEDFCLDLFTRMRDKTLDDFRPRLRHLETSGVRIPYLAPVDLIFLKEGSWRDKDKLDVQAMREIVAREAR